MAPLVPMEVLAHMALPDLPGLPVLPWAHTTLDRTTRDLQDHSEYSSQVYFYLRPYGYVKPMLI